MFIFARRANAGLRHGQRLAAPLLAIALVTIAGCRKAGPPFGVDEAIRTFKVEPGFHVEKYASEPMVESPVAMDIDEKWPDVRG